MTSKDLAGDDESVPSAQAAAPSRSPVWRSPFVIGGVALAVVAAAAIAVLALYPKPLATRDPAGALACQQMADWQTGKTGANQVVAATALADQASKAATESIRKTVGEPVFDEQTMALLRGAGYKAGNMRFANLHDLHTACVGEDVDMPPWVES